MYMMDHSYPTGPTGRVNSDCHGNARCRGPPSGTLSVHTIFDRNQFDIFVNGLGPFVCAPSQDPCDFIVLTSMHPP